MEFQRSHRRVLIHLQLTPSFPETTEPPKTHGVFSHGFVMPNGKPPFDSPAEIKNSRPNRRNAVIFADQGQNQFPTRVPMTSPVSARRMLPGSFMLKTTMGMLFSMHKEKAVASITLS